VAFVALLVLFAVAVGSVYYVKYRVRQARVRSVAVLAQRIGFTFTESDPDHVVDMPFGLFSKGDGRRVELVVSGRHNDLPLRLFDYWYYDNQSDGRGNRSRTYHRFTCALLTIPAACPSLRITHEDFLTRLGDHLGLHDVELEYEDFNKRFRVKCDHQKFAFALLDGKMMQWLLGADHFEALEIVGPWVLLAVPKLDPLHWLDLGAWLDHFQAHVPTVVYSTFPPR
jgi:hypothetical protein